MPYYAMRYMLRRFISPLLILLFFLFALFVIFTIIFAADDIAGASAAILR